MLRKIFWFLTVAVLLCTGALGIYNGVMDHPGPALLQKSVTIAVVLYGVFGISGAIGMIARRRWSVWLVTAWGICIIYAASVAVIAYAGTDATATGALAAGVSAAVIAIAVIWSARAALTDPTVAPRA